MRVRKLDPRRWTRASAKGGYASGLAAAALVAAIGVALLVWLVVIPATRVQAATYTVNAVGDAIDDNAGDGQCHTAGGQCTLRAAIMEANASVAQDVIAIGVAGPIVLLSGLPAITDGGLVITGSGQQVSLTAPGTAFTINADSVQINSLIIDGEGVGTVGIQISTTSDDLILDGLTVRGFTDDGFDNGVGGGGQRNTIRNSTFTGNAGNGIDFNGGANDTVTNDVITNNGDNVGDNGLEVNDEDNLLIQGSTFSGNFDSQILIAGLQAGQHVNIIQNTITAGSDGIVIGAAVNATAHIDIGLSVENRNVFRGTIAAPAEQYLRDLSAVNINAIYNDWNAYTDAAIEGVICHGPDGVCGTGVVDYDPFITTPSPLPTATPPATVTPTLGGATETPTVTATVTPGGVETLPLTAGCNPEAWTGSDNTPIATIDSAVSPSGILVALWSFEGGVWRGYSPQFADVSDLQEMNRLDVVFVCVSDVGTFNRPVI